MFGEALQSDLEIVRIDPLVVGIAGCDRVRAADSEHIGNISDPSNGIADKVPGVDNVSGPGQRRLDHLQVI